MQWSPPSPKEPINTAVQHLWCSPNPYRVSNTLPIWLRAQTQVPRWHALLGRVLLLCGVNILWILGCIEPATESPFPWHSWDNQRCTWLLVSSAYTEESQLVGRRIKYMTTWTISSFLLWIIRSSQMHLFFIYQVLVKAKGSLHSGEMWEF